MANKSNRGEDFAPTRWSMKGFKSSADYMPRKMDIMPSPKKMPRRMTPMQKQTFNRKRLATAADRVMSGTQTKGRVKKSIT